MVDLKIVKDWWSVAVVLVLVACFAAMSWVFGESEVMKAWLEKPLRDASIKDVVLLLIAVVLVAK